jgi:hypothetical protein
MVFDLADYIPFIGSTIKIHGLPRAIAGTAVRPVPVHFPIGGTFIKPPGNEDENFMGSATVSFDGDAATYMLLPALTCQDMGMIAPPRLNPKKSYQNEVHASSLEHGITHSRRATGNYLVETNVADEYTDVNDRVRNHSLLTSGLAVSLFLTTKRLVCIKLQKGRLLMNTELKLRI